MRKYFLTCAVALLATSTANATTDYAEVMADVTIEIAGTLTCHPISFGNIVVKNNNSEIKIITEAETQEVTVVGDDLLRYSFDNTTINCDEVTHYYDLTHPNSVTLKNADGEEIQLSFTTGDIGMGSTLTIPSGVKAGNYSNSFEVTYIQE